MLRTWTFLIAFFPALICGAELKEHAVADWIAAQGGRVQRNQAGQVTGVDLGGTWITDADLEHIGRIGTLRKLNLANTKVTDAGIEHLKALQNVVDLNLYYAEYITDIALAHLKGWKHLEILTLRGDRITSGAFEHIAQMTGLRSLDISFTEVDDDGFEQLSALTKLESLAMGGNRLSGTALSSLKLLPSLRKLDVGGMQRVDSGRWGLALSEANLTRLSELTELRALSLTGANLNDRGVDRPGNKLSERTELANLSKLRGLGNLEFLDLSRTPVLPSALTALRDLPKLRELRLGLTPRVDDSAVDALISLKQLSTLQLGGSQMSSEGLERLRTARPECKVTSWK
jgi:Leucine-rich repeat (LRR) protein